MFGREHRELRASVLRGEESACNVPTLVCKQEVITKSQTA